MFSLIYLHLHSDHISKEAVSATSQDHPNRCLQPPQTGRSPLCPQSALLLRSHPTTLNTLIIIILIFINFSCFMYGPEGGFDEYTSIISQRCKKLQICCYLFWTKFASVLSKLLFASLSFPLQIFLYMIFIVVSYLFHAKLQSDMRYSMYEWSQLQGGGGYWGSVRWRNLFKLSNVESQV